MNPFDDKPPTLDYQPPEERTRDKPSRVDRAFASIFGFVAGVMVGFLLVFLLTGVLVKLKVRSETFGFLFMGVPIAIGLVLMLPRGTRFFGLGMALVPLVLFSVLYVACGGGF